MATPTQSELLAPRDFAGLKRFIDERIEETTWLEFKRQLPDSGKNDDLAKDLAAMANTEGGVIIYGIGQDENGRAKELHPFGVSSASERVTLVAQTLDEPLTLRSVYSIPDQSDSDLGFLVVYVPRSQRAPHFFRGTALARTSKGNVPLTRRQVGELFARLTGFAEEFGLVVGKPGRLFVAALSEPYQETDFYGQMKADRREYLVFRNDGETDIQEDDWEWATRGDEDYRFPVVPDNPFPLKTLQSGAELKILVVHEISTPATLKVRTSWRDEHREQKEEVWVLTW